MVSLVVSLVSPLMATLRCGSGGNGQSAREPKIILRAFSDASTRDGWSDPIPVPSALAQSAFKFPASFAPADGDDIEIESLIRIVSRQKSNRAQKLIADRLAAACFDHLQSAVMEAAAA